MNIKRLERAGLDERGSRIYVALLELKEATVTKIAKKTKINRSLLYFILSELEEKGFVTYIIRNNVRYYRPIEPEKILTLLKENVNSFASFLPNLNFLYKTKKDKPQIEILEGREGIKTILNEILRLKKDWHAFNVPGTSRKILGYMLDNFTNQRAKKGIKLYAIFLKTKQGLERGKSLARMKNTSVRFMPEEYESPASNYIYGDRIVIVFWYEQFPFAVRIIDKNLADSYKKYFDALWKTAKK